MKYLHLCIFHIKKLSFVKLFTLLSISSVYADDIDFYKEAINIITNSTEYKILTDRYKTDNLNSLCISKQILGYKNGQYLKDVIEFENLYLDSVSKLNLYDSLSKVDREKPLQITYNDRITYLNKTVDCSFRVYFSEIENNKFIAYVFPISNCDDFKESTNMLSEFLNYIFFIKEEEIFHSIGSITYQ